MRSPAHTNRLAVVHLAQSDREGGANRAAYRLHTALLRAGVGSTFHCGRKLGEGTDVVEAAPAIAARAASTVAAYLNARALRAYPNRGPAAFSPVKLSYGRLDANLLARADVVCVHWIAGAFLTPAKLARIRRPLVWRLSDLWPFTGGCHYPGTCRQFESECGCCPILGSTRGRGSCRAMAFVPASRLTPTSIDLTVVAPSRWIAEHARRSHLFGGHRIEHIPTGVDLAVFRPRDRGAARAGARSANGPKLILFGALAPRRTRAREFSTSRRARRPLQFNAHGDDQRRRIRRCPTMHPSATTCRFPQSASGASNEEQQARPPLRCGRRIRRSFRRGQPSERHP